MNEEEFVRKQTVICNNSSKSKYGIISVQIAFQIFSLSPIQIDSQISDSIRKSVKFVNRVENRKK